MCCWIGWSVWTVRYCRITIFALGFGLVQHFRWKDIELASSCPVSHCLTLKAIKRDLVLIWLPIPSKHSDTMTRRIIEGLDGIRWTASESIDTGQLTNSRSNDSYLSHFPTVDRGNATWGIELRFDFGHRSEHNNRGHFNLNLFQNAW
jgi:hypothetical protein